MHPFLVMQFHDRAWPHLAVRWLLVSQGPVSDDGYACGVVSGRRDSSEVLTFSSVEWCDKQVAMVYEPKLAEAGFVFTGRSAVVMLDPSLVLDHRWEDGWARTLLSVVGNAFMDSLWPPGPDPERGYWRGTQADYDAIKNKQPGVIYEITDR